VGCDDFWFNIAPELLVIRPELHSSGLPFVPGPANGVSIKPKIQGCQPDRRLFAFQIRLGAVLYFRPTKSLAA
jgi:hypothetical protein